jgi:hypothetical protein
VLGSIALVAGGVACNDKRVSLMNDASVSVVNAPDPQATDAASRDNQGITSGHGHAQTTTIDAGSATLASTVEGHATDARTDAAAAIETRRASSADTSGTAADAASAFTTRMPVADTATSHLNDGGRSDASANEPIENAVSDGSSSFTVGDASEGSTVDDGGPVLPEGSDAGASTAVSSRPDASNTTSSSMVLSAAIADAGSSSSSSTDLDASSSLDAGAFELTSLAVSGGRYPLKPAFDPATRRYSVVATSNSAVLSLNASAGDLATIEVNGEPIPTGETVSLDAVAPGTDVTIVVGEGADSTTYVVRYLPRDFPDLVVTQPRPGASTDPLYLNIGLSNIHFAVKLDNNGVPIDYKRENDRIIDVKKHPTGQISYSVLEDVDFAGVTQIVFDENFQETSRLKAVGLNNTDNHEFLILPNGNYVFLSYERAIRDLTPFGGELAEEVEDSVFQEVSQDMQVLFQWNSWDHVDFGESHYAFTGNDYAHANSIVVDDDGNWLVSLRGYSQVLKIDRTSGDVIWRFGGFSNEFTFINDPYDGTCGQHTASRLPNGNLLIFDNGTGCDAEILGSRSNYSRVVEYALDEDAKTARLVWSYHRPGAFARSQGSAQRLANGNTMIGWGNGPPVLATEVDANGNVVFELEARPTSGTSQCYRARRFPD